MSRVLIVTLACLVLLSVPAASEGDQIPATANEAGLLDLRPVPFETVPPTGAPPVTARSVAEPVAEESALDGFNRAMHGFNLWVWETADSAMSWVSFLAPPEAVREGISNILLNFINEPISVVSWAVAGDYSNAAVAAQRFWINTVNGWFGTQDVASAHGIKVPQIDIGLALCARGVGEGGYVVLPFVGPRTYRDGLSDFLFINGLTYLALAPVAGFPPSLQSFTVIELTEEAWRVAVMRQIDHGDNHDINLNHMRDKYLATRRARCADIIKARDQPQSMKQVD